MRLVGINDDVTTVCMAPGVATRRLRPLVQLEDKWRENDLGMQ